MHQKGFVPVLIVLLIAALAVTGGFLYFKSQDRATSISRQTVSYSTPTPYVTPSSEKTIIKLSDAWKLGTKTYSNPKIRITFEYPLYFDVNETDIEKENRDWSEQYKNNPDVKQPLYRSSFQARFFTPELESGSDSNMYREICDNKMSVSVQKYDNNQNLPLYDFIADLNATYPGGGITETFDTYKKSLTKISIPKEDSYIFTGIIGENPVKEVYFDKNNTVYQFHLIGNCDTGGKYTEDAEKVFIQILGSVKILQSIDDIGPI